jgi:hypothetical protein
VKESFLCSPFPFTSVSIPLTILFVALGARGYYVFRLPFIKKISAIKFTFLYPFYKSRGHAAIALEQIYGNVLFFAY